MKKLFFIFFTFLAFLFILGPTKTLAGCFAPNDMGLCDSGATCPPGPGYGFCCDDISECGGVVNPGNEQFSCRWNGTSCEVGVANCSLPGSIPDPSFCAGFTTQTACTGSIGNCEIPSVPSVTDPTCPLPGGGKGIDTAIGCIPFGDSSALIGFLLRWAIGIGGGIAFILILVAGFQIITSQGDPQKLQAGKELLTSAIVGLLLIIFSVFILEVIGVDILGIPGFNQ